MISYIFVNVHRNMCVCHTDKHDTGQCNQDNRHDQEPEDTLKGTIQRKDTFIVSLHMRYENNQFTHSTDTSTKTNDLMGRWIFRVILSHSLGAFIPRRIQCHRGHTWNTSNKPQRRLAREKIYLRRPNVFLCRCV